MSVPEIVLYRRSCNNLSEIALSDRPFLDTISTLLSFAKTLEIDVIVSFCNTKTKSIGDDLYASSSLMVPVTRLVCGTFKSQSS